MNSISSHSIFSTRVFILVVILLEILIYVLTFSFESITPDDSTNLLLGREMLEGRYSIPFFQRMPLIPSLCSLLYLIGFGTVAIRFILPLLFMVLSIPATFLFVREFTKNENVAKWSSILLLAFPEFWRWGEWVLVDVPLLVFSMFSLYCFLKALKDRRYFIRCGFFWGLGMVTKLSFIILPVFLFLYLLVKRRQAFRTRELWLGIFLSALIFLSFFGLVYHFSGSAGLMPLERISSNVGRISHSIVYFFNLALFPLIIFFPFGVYALYRRRKTLPGFWMIALYFFLTIPIFIVFWVIRLRYFSPLYPILMMFVIEGFLWARGRLNPRRMVDALFAIFLIISFMDSMYLVSLSSNTYWGVEDLAGYAKTLDGRIATDYLPSYYINITSDVIVDDAMLNLIFSENFTYSLVRENDIDYIILSIYGDYGRYLSETGSPPDTYSPYLGPLELTFVKRPYSSERPPPSYRFSSGLYRQVEGDSRFSKIKELRRGEQTIFVVYEVL